MADADGSESWLWKVCGVCCCHRHDVLAKVRADAARSVGGSFADRRPARGSSIV